MGEDQSREEKVSVASTHPAKSPNFKKYDDLTYDHKNYIHDYVDLQDLGRSIEAARKALFLITEQQNRTSRFVAKRKLEKDKAWRRAFLDATQKTDSLKRMWADLLVEDIEDDIVTAGQYLEELGREANAMRLELQSLQAIGNNIRQQVRGI